MKGLEQFITPRNRQRTPEDELRHHLVNYAYLNAGKLKFKETHYEGNFIFPEERSICELLEAALNYTTNSVWKKEVK